MVFSERAKRKKIVEKAKIVGKQRQKSNLATARGGTSVASTFTSSLNDSYSLLTILIIVICLSGITSVTRSIFNVLSIVTVVFLFVSYSLPPFKRTSCSCDTGTLLHVLATCYINRYYIIHAVYSSFTLVLYTVQSHVSLYLRNFIPKDSIRLSNFLFKTYFTFI